MTNFLGTKNLPITQDKIGQSCNLFSTLRVCQRFLKMLNPAHALVSLPGQVWLQSPLMRAVGTRAAVPKGWVETQTWVAKGRKMGHAKVIPICQNELFSFHFSSSFNSVIDWINASYAFHLASSYQNWIIALWVVFREFQWQRSYYP